MESQTQLISYRNNSVIQMQFVVIVVVLFGCAVYRFKICVVFATMSWENSVKILSNQKSKYTYIYNHKEKQTALRCMPLNVNFIFNFL